MFVIKPNNHAEWQYVMFILSYHQVQCTMYSDGDHFESAYMVVDKEYNEFELLDSKEENQLRMAEATFQLNWHQGGSICPHCEGDKPCIKCAIFNECADPGNKDCTGHKQICGHLTFVRRINPAF